MNIQAASLLKRAEGIVTLIVCNPNKKDDKREDTNKTPKYEKKGKHSLSAFTVATDEMQFEEHKKTPF